MLVTVNSVCTEASDEGMPRVKSAQSYPKDEEMCRLPPFSYRPMYAKALRPCSIHILNSLPTRSLSTLTLSRTHSVLPGTNHLS